jgi:hypothetical protein
MASALNLEAKVAIALVSGLLYQLRRRDLLTAEEASEVFDASLSILEGMPLDEKTTALRQTLEQAARRVAGLGGRTPDQ